MTDTSAPDLILTHGRFTTMDPSMPDPEAVAMAADRGQSAEFRAALRGKLERARWIVEALEQRRQTLLRVAQRAFHEQRAQDEHAGLHRIGAHENLGHEENAVAEILADDPHAFDQRLCQNFIRRPAALQKDVGAFLDLFLEPVIQIVMHLLDKFIIGKLGEDDFIVRHGFGEFVANGVKFCKRI
mgnify:CR=1 FL=1